jgi:hypothetical protein
MRVVQHDRPWDTSNKSDIYNGVVTRVLSVSNYHQTKSRLNGADVTKDVPTLSAILLRPRAALPVPPRGSFCLM